jgi:hypothetical protein
VGKQMGLFCKYHRLPKANHAAMIPCTGGLYNAASLLTTAAQ